MLTEFSQVENTNQLATFGLAVVLGMLLCLLYDCHRTLAHSFSFPQILVHFSDIVYFILCAILCFCFLLVECQGEIRIYAVGGFVFGFFLFRHWISRYARKFIQKLFAFFTRLFSYIFRPIYGGFRLCCRKILPKVKKIKKTMLLFSKKKEKTLAKDGEYDV